MILMKNKVKAMLANRNMGFKDFAKQTGIKYPNLMGLLNSKTPTLLSLKKIAEALNITVSTLISGTELDDGRDITTKKGVSHEDTEGKGVSR